MGLQTGTRAAGDREADGDSPEVSLWNLSIDMMATVDPSGFLTHVNPAWEETVGFTPDELMARPYLEFLHPDDVVKAAAELAAQRDAGHITRRFESRFCCKDGAYLWLSWSCRTAPDGSVVYCVVRDITARLRDQEVIAELNDTLVAQTRSLSQLNRDLLRSNRDLEQFAYVASHDLSEPLRSVTGYVQLLARRYQGRLDDDADEFIGFAIDGVARMQALIKDLLAYARAGAVGDPVPVDCAELVADVIAVFGSTRPGAELVVGTMPTILSERAQLHQVLDNLVSNALKFVPPDRTPRVVISAARCADGWAFTVADNGIGIDERHQQRIFGLFARLHSRSEYSGTGIGLAICQRVVERLGGTLTVRSTVGVGSEFTVTLPDNPPGPLPLPD